MRWRALLAVVVTGCASANVGSSGGDDAGDDDPPPIDAPDDDVDAPPGVDAGIAETLVQITSTQNVASNSIFCPTGQHSFYRVFPLAASGITGGYNVTQVTFGTQQAGGSPPVQVKIGTYAGTVGAATLDLAQITNINSAVQTLPNTANPGNNVVTPITGFIPAGSNLIVEIFMPNNTPTQFFAVGASNAGETAPGYVRLSVCTVNGNNVAIPRSTASVGFPAVNLNITVTGVR